MYRRIRLLSTLTLFASVCAGTYGEGASTCRGGSSGRPTRSRKSRPFSGLAAMQLTRAQSGATFRQSKSESGSLRRAAGEVEAARTALETLETELALADAAGEEDRY